MSIYSYYLLLLLLLVFFPNMTTDVAEAKPSTPLPLQTSASVYWFREFECYHSPADQLHHGVPRPDLAVLTDDSSISAGLIALSNPKT